jgi:hypothetical protein
MAFVGQTIVMDVLQTEARHVTPLILATSGLKNALGLELLLIIGRNVVQEHQM